ncbi:MAG: hypothetical protein ACLT98_03360 [Eggerthellaceae bacterium]
MTSWFAASAAAEFRVGGGHGGLLQRVGGQLGRGLHRAMAEPMAFHRIDVEGGAGRLGLQRTRLLLVECDDRVRRRVAVALNSSTAVHRVREAAPAEAAKLSVSSCSRAFRSGRSQGSCCPTRRRRWLARRTETPASFAESFIEALPRNSHGVIAQGVVEDGLHFGRRFQRHVVVPQHGVRHEAVGEVKAAGHVGDQQQAHNGARDDADDLGRRETPSGGGFRRACRSGRLVGGCGVFHKASWVMRRMCVVLVERVAPF